MTDEGDIEKGGSKSTPEVRAGISRSRGKGLGHNYSFVGTLSEGDTPLERARVVVVMFDILNGRDPYSLVITDPFSRQEPGVEELGLPDLFK